MRSKNLIFFIFSIVFYVMTISPAVSQDLQRGLRNYQEIMSGKKRFDQLSPQETKEVMIIYQRQKAQAYGNDKSSECQDALSQAENNASGLANYARRLRNCAETQDYSDDCSSEFRRTKNAFNDYESAVSSVGSYCR